MARLRIGKARPNNFAQLGWIAAILTASSHAYPLVADKSVSSCWTETSFCCSSEVMASMTAQVARPVVVCKSSHRTPSFFGPAKPFAPALQRPTMSPCVPSLGLRSQARKQLRGVKLYAQDTETAAGSFMYYVKSQWTTARKMSWHVACSIANGIPTRCVPCRPRDRLDFRGASPEEPCPCSG